MSSTDIVSQRTAGSPSLTDIIAARIAGAAARWRAARQRRNSVLRLRSLDDRMLADIGISRSEIASIVYGGATGRRRHHEVG
jgi:uncharacterized protein YjiS (DUF1127 family)